MRLMYDSTSAAAIPADAQMVAGYVDGIYRWSDADWARFPGAAQVRIAVNPATNDGHVLDVEPGNWDAAASVDWTLMRRVAGLAEPTVYCGTWAPGYTWQDVLNAFASRGVPPPLIWLANYDGLQAIPDGCIAKQYVDVGPYDLSAAADYWPGVDDAPPVPPDPCEDLRVSLASINNRAAAALDANAAERLTLQAVYEDSRYDGGSRTGGQSMGWRNPPPAAQTAGALVVPAWASLVLAIVLIVASQVAQAVSQFPGWHFAALALAALGVVTGSVAAIQALLAQQNAHALVMQGRENASYERAQQIRSGSQTVQH